MALPYVLDGESGLLEVSTGGKGYEIMVKTDPIQQRPVINLSNSKPPIVKNGTSVVVHWPDSARLELESQNTEFLQLASNFTMLNPHLAITVDVPQGSFECQPTDSNWTKWLPSDPTPPH